MGTDSVGRLTRNPVSLQQLCQVLSESFSFDPAVTSLLHHPLTKAIGKDDMPQEVPSFFPTNLPPPCYNYAIKNLDVHGCENLRSILASACSRSIRSLIHLAIQLLGHMCSLHRGLRGITITHVHSRIVENRLRVLAHKVRDFAILKQMTSFALASPPRWS